MDFQVSLAAAGMCMWVHAMDQYADIFEGVKPKMDTVEVLNKELEDANTVLRAKRHEVERIEEEVYLLMQVKYVDLNNMIYIRSGMLYNNRMEFPARSSRRPS